MLKSCKGRYFKRNSTYLGGDSVVVQIDESLFCHKTKYHRGRFAQDPVWVFGIFYCSFVPSKGFRKVIENISADTLLPIINSVCLPGTIIHSDEWRAIRIFQEI